MAKPKKQKLVHILEDEHVLGDVLSKKLIDEGYEVTWSMDGESGLAAMRKKVPDLVLLDVVMPKKDGYEVLEEMSKDATLKNVAVVVISNSGQPVEIEHILKLGARDYIVKAQFSPEEVMAKVQKYIGQDEATTKPDPAKGSKGLRILVVEDDPFLLSLAAERLVKEGYAVTSVTDGEQALKELEAGIPDLVLLDIIMPVMSGFEVLKRMRADPKFKDIPVIIFSNLGQDHEIEEGKQLGADDFLVKAKFTLGEVMEKIDSVLKRRGKAH